MKNQSLSSPNLAVSTPLAQGITLGLLGGLAGTVVMDLVLVGLFSATGLPKDLTFSFIGETAAIFFARMGVPVPGGVPLGLVIHYLIGPALGALFGAAVSQVHSLRRNGPARGSLLGILYIEIISQPILVTAPLLRAMTRSETLQWFGLSFFMHLICGAVLGLVVSYGVKAAAQNQISSKDTEALGLQ